MRRVERRDFIKVAGTGLGAFAVSGLFSDRLAADRVSVPGGSVLEAQFGVALEDARKVLEAALSRGADFAEIYFEHKIAGSLTVEDDIVKESAEEVVHGAGVRVLKGPQWGYAYTSDLSLEAMKGAAMAAASVAESAAGARVVPFSPQEAGRRVYSLEGPVAKAELPAKIALVKEAYSAALAHDKRIIKASATLLDEWQSVAIVNSEGLLASDTRPQTRLIVRATAEQNGERSTGAGSAGGRVGMAFYGQEGTRPRDVGAEAAREAVTLLGAVNAQAGEQAVVLGRGQSGVMVHEAVGHPLEADGNWKKTSIMWDKLGQTVATPVVTIYDDATIPGFRGSLAVDDEGTPTRPVTLIEKGKLVGFLHDRLSARIMKLERNGHGRRDSYRSPAIPRMCNTVLAKGETPPEEILRSVKRGLYAQTYQGGMVQGTGKFTFSVNLGYLIEDGKLTRPVKNATLIGTNVQILKDIELVGNDMDFFLGNCGKGGQWATVTAGTPTLKIRSMTVGGRA
ncbi:MAG: TldD/PmbA family protein [Acidobacteriota bacterium]